MTSGPLTEFIDEQAAIHPLLFRAGPVSCSYSSPLPPRRAEPSSTAATREWAAWEVGGAPILRTEPTALFD
jgi:hypothetical protein